jgi:glycosyltransferase involved in cell wall biosynthesis
MSHRPLETKMNLNTTVLVVPLFNEFSRGSFRYLEQLIRIKSIDFVLVNDGSTDETEYELTNFSNMKNVQTVNLEKNLGKSAAIQAGLASAVAHKKYMYLGYLDGDSAFTLAEVERITSLAALKLGENKFTVLCSSRVDLAGHEIQRSTYRHLLGRVIRTIIDIRHSNLPYDTQSGFKIFLNTESLVTALNKPFETKWFVDIEILLRLRLSDSNLKIWEEPLLEWKDIGKSSISWKSSAAILRDLTRILRVRNK